MAMKGEFEQEIRFEIVEALGVLTAHSTGWKKELNLVSWNGGQPKYDIRDWSPDHAHMSRGVTLHEKEMRQIFDLMRRKRQSQYRGRHGEMGNGNGTRENMVPETSLESSVVSEDGATLNGCVESEEMEVMEAIAEGERDRHVGEPPDETPF